MRHQTLFDAYLRGATRNTDRERRRLRRHNAISMFLIGLTALVVVTAFGCAAVVPLSPELDDMHAKQFAVPVNKASIYLYRNESFGSGITMTVAVDGRVAGQSGPNTYFLWQVEPGAHEISSYAEGVSTIKVDAQPGQSYFIWQEVKLKGLLFSGRLHDVDAATGHKAVAQCKRAQSVA